MITWLYSLFGDESTLMPYFMRYYAPQVDRLIMLDGGSTEETRQAIYPYANAVIEETPFTPSCYDEVDFVVFIAEKYKEARGKADWVIIADVDEFLYPGYPLQEALALYQQHEILAVQAEGYQMLAEEPPAGERQLTDLVRLGVRDQIYDKTSIFDPTLNIRWSVGRHSCRVDGYVPNTTAGMKLLHYRYFGEAYMRERNARNFARKSLRDVETGRSYHVDPDYTDGRYSINWFKHELAHNAQDVVSEEWPIIAQPLN